MKLNPRVKKASAGEGHILHLVFTNGEEKLFDVSPLLGQGIFRELHDESVFRSVKVSHGSVQWAGGQDICPDTLYEDSIPMKHASVAESRSKYSRKRKLTSKRR